MRTKLALSMMNDYMVALLSINIELGKHFLNSKEIQKIIDVNVRNVGSKVISE
ncbi:hypothetical protein H4J46_02210 [Colwellia sp. MB02u-6]|jgi:hypothetical protein|uniref:hypothetical protein n=1 Tax=Colwellia sp. MB02u-6 TaxID=2759824 RepID=UPI0015F48D60|nr:hypothetical protein [Colwellia sp. MB02u-6]MBA6326765.1 hypothetical protein [Colwellia sp. MB02u-6]